MQPRASIQRNRAMTLVEVLVVIALLILLAAVLIPRFIAANSRPETISCANNVKQILLSYREWADDHGGKFPMEISVVNGGTKELIAMGDAISSFQVISNELLDPRILYCWSDTNHTIFQLSPGPHFIGSLPTNFSSASVLKNHISYFVGLDASANHPNALLCGDDNFEIGGAPVKPGLLEISTNTAVGWTLTRHMTYKRHFWDATTSYGNIGFVDGSVQITTISSRTNLLDGFAPSCVSSFASLLQAPGLATNRLAIP